MVHYILGTSIFSVGLILFLSAPEIARGLARFWGRWLDRPASESNGNSVSPAAETIQPPYYRTRLVMWRVLGSLFILDGLIWIVMATAEVFRAMPAAKP